MTESIPPYHEHVSSHLNKETAFVSRLLTASWRLLLCPSFAWPAKICLDNFSLISSKAWFTEVLTASLLNNKDISQTGTLHTYFSIKFCGFGFVYSVKV